MAIATLTTKGQITIPVDVRRQLGLRPGSRVDFVYVREGVVELVPVSGTVKSLKGMVPAPDTPVTLEQMDDAIAEGAARRAR
jgi:AbrB family looped-hinge helix DNA binding protein